MELGQEVGQQLLDLVRKAVQTIQLAQLLIPVGYLLAVPRVGGGK